MKYKIIIAGMMLGKKYYCNKCGKEVTGFKDRESAREFRITKLCQKCQNKLFKKG